MLFVLGLLSLSVCAQDYVHGVVVEQGTQRVLSEALIKYCHTEGVFRTDRNGGFNIPRVVGDTIIVSSLGFSSIKVAVGRDTRGLHLALERADLEIEQVEVSTGYFRIPKERATGSFVQIDAEMLERNPAPSILQRLEGMASGLQFVKSNGSKAEDIRVRGLSTIESNAQPLIALDNFPYQGDLDQIDPNDVESITILKDAAAASIWGAMAGNGVIVIQSKKAKLNNRVNVNVYGNTTIAQRPDLFFNKNWLPSEAVMEIEKERYGKGMYTFGENIPVPYYVDLLDLLKNDKIDRTVFLEEEKRLKSIDVRQQATDHLYRQAVLKQYGAIIGGGNAGYSYKLSAGINGDDQHVVGNSNSRIVLGLQNRATVNRFLDIGLQFNYTEQQARANGVGYPDLAQFYAASSFLSPYMALMDDNGIPSAIVKDIRYSYAMGAIDQGLLDWMYRPLDERGLVDRRSTSREFRINTDLGGEVLPGLKWRMFYQYTKGDSRSTDHAQKESYFARNLVNTYTQPNGTQVIPNNGIFQTGNPTLNYSHYGRFQLDFNREFGTDIQLNSLAGAEVRHAQSEIFPASILYNYNDEYLKGSSVFNFNQSYQTRPAGKPAMFIPGASSIRKKLFNRDLSYYANMGMTFYGRYILSGSVRWDASNLFGVKTNQKGVPLWSTGVSWDISKESFYNLEDLLPYIRARGSVGRSGNVNKSVTHYPTVQYGTSQLGQLMASVLYFGNPSLRWEKVYTYNAAVDWRSKGNVLHGTVEYYVKDGNDLIGDQILDPTIGITAPYKVNYADITSKGWDFQLGSNLTFGNLNWRTDLNVSVVHNEIKNYEIRETKLVSSYWSSAIPPPEIGKSRDVLYGFPWHGLNDQGLPIAYLDGEVVQNYSKYMNPGLRRDMLLDAGVTVPTRYGSLRNSIAWRDFSFSFMLLWKAGHVFRRTSMLPDGESKSQYHTDYYDRWQNPGDESTTNVPKKLTTPDVALAEVSAISNYYKHSEQLITKGGLFRLADVRLGYTLGKEKVRFLPFNSVNLSAYATNLGLIWTANKEGLDPDYVNMSYRPPFQINFGINVNF